MDIFVDPAFSKYYREFPLVLVDVGASGGVENKWRAAEKYLHVVAFEPDKRAFPNLVNSSSLSSVRYISTALYRERAVVNFYLTRKQEVSSIFKPNRSFLDRFPESERFDIVRTVRIETDTLDSQLQGEQIQDVDFMKIDTQGSELFILEGATRILQDSIVGLEVEVEFAQVYLDQPLFSDVDSFLRNFGFQLFDLRPYYWKRTVGRSYGRVKGQIITAECLYLRDIDGVKRVLERIEDGVMRKSKVLRALSICLLYGYLDYAVEIFEEARGMFSADEAQAFFTRISREVPLSRRIPNFRGRGRVAGLFLALYNVFRPTYHGWATVGNVLGNLE